MANLKKIKSRNILVESNDVHYYMFIRAYNYLGVEFLQCKEIPISQFLMLDIEKARLFVFKHFPRSYYIVLPSEYQLFSQIYSSMLHYGQLIEVDYE